jgi:hypothetical protein
MNEPYVSHPSPHLLRTSFLLLLRLRTVKILNRLKNKKKDHSLKGLPIERTHCEGARQRLWEESIFAEGGELDQGYLSIDLADNDNYGVEESG